MAKWESCQLCGQKAHGLFIHLVDQPSNKIKKLVKRLDEPWFVGNKRFNRPLDKLTDQTNTLSWNDHGPRVRK